MILGEQTFFYPNGPDPLGIFNAHEYVDILTTAIKYHGRLNFAFGLNTKRIVSKLSSSVAVSSSGSFRATGKVTAFNIGTLVHFPIITNHNSPGSGLYPSLDLNVAATLGNYSFSKITYIDASQADPLPRVVRLGVGGKAGFTHYSENGRSHSLASLEIQLEAEDLLAKAEFKEDPVSGISTRTTGYRSTLNIFGVVDNIFTNSSKGHVSAKAGVEINFLEILSLRGGRYRSGGDAVKYNTYGFGLQLSGFTKYLHGKYPDNEIMNFLYEHVAFEYNYATYSIDNNTSYPIDNPKYHSIRLGLF